MPKDIPGVMNEWKSGTLHSGSKNGPPVKSHAQAVAIALSEKEKKKGLPRGPRKFRRTSLTRVPTNVFDKEE